ncbi:MULTISPECIES: YciI family protein [unclassified Psychrobacter]|uniref:YciI family protein n=1 Tax=unclassified Psychrobacter TaxID=196806 RepID=UPI0025B50FF5|nr:MULTISPECIES: YciI family protein [unclassified Psychrobacter]MDN3452495.1 YciI family protein [Psychrobacter sp. APC 3350]MDN3502365.1 YciI family protein [Psychrobacter sp. 5A.1]
MSLFAIIGHDVANSSAQRQITRTEHIERLKLLNQQGRLIIAGPTPIEHGKNDMSGSLIIADFDSIDAAQAWANDEPYLRDGVYSHVDIKPFVQALPAPTDRTDQVAAS